ncbi:MAG: hypothetical protein EOO43_21170, partial [Flavobacterium sp.]
MNIVSKVLTFLCKHGGDILTNLIYNACVKCGNSDVMYFFSYLRDFNTNPIKISRLKNPMFAHVLNTSSIKNYNIFRLAMMKKTFFNILESVISDLCQQKKMIYKMKYCEPLKDANLIMTKSAADNKDFWYEDINDNTADDGVMYMTTEGEKFFQSAFRGFTKDISPNERPAIQNACLKDWQNDASLDLQRVQMSIPSFENVYILPLIRGIKEKFNQDKPFLWQLHTKRGCMISNKSYYEMKLPINHNIKIEKIDAYSNLRNDARLGVCCLKLDVDFSYLAFTPEQPIP